MSSSKPAHIFHPHSGLMSTILPLHSIMPLVTSLESAACTTNISMQHPPRSMGMHNMTVSSSRRMQMRLDSAHWVLPKSISSCFFTITPQSIHVLLCSGSRLSEMHYVLTTTSTLDARLALLHWFHPLCCSFNWGQWLILPSTRTFSFTFPLCFQC